MALFKAIQVLNRLPIPSADGATDVIAIVGDWAVPAGVVVGDVVEMCGLPAGYVPVDILIDHDSLGEEATADVGLLSGGYNDHGARKCGAQLADDQPLDIAGFKRASAAGAGRIAPAESDRGVGFVFTALAAPTKGASLRMTLLARPAFEGV
jgi:hypothetical protein